MPTVSMQFTVVLALACLLSSVSTQPDSDPRSFTDDPFEDDKFREQVSQHEIVSVFGGRAEIPCDVTPSANHPEDEPHLILWYKEPSRVPIYSFDMRSGLTGRHWMDNKTLGGRGFFYFDKSGGFGHSVKSFLGIEPVRVPDGGKYRCRVDFSQSPTRNTRIKLKLVVPPGPPVILSEEGRVLSEVTDPCEEGGRLRLYCETTGGEPLPRLTWRRDGVPIEPIGQETDFRAGLVRSTILVKDMKRGDQGSLLTCTASNSDLTPPATTKIKIELMFPPIRAKIVREWSYFSMGKVYNVSCQVLGSRPPAATSIWIGQHQLNTIKYEVSPDGNVSTTTAELTPTDQDNGKFLSCRAENPLIPDVSVEDQWKIIVHFVPRSTIKFEESQFLGYSPIIREGDNVQIKCQVSANPLPHTIEWLHGEELLEVVEGGNIVMTEDLLILSEVKREDSGQYSCLATNQVGRGPSNQLTLDVMYAPVCATETGAVVNVEKHESISLLCELEANPQDLDFTWTFLSSRDSSPLDIARSQFTGLGLQSSLAYTPKTDLDYGTIVCKASNLVGETANPCSYTVRPAGRPQKLRNCSAHNQTYTSLTVECTAGFDGGLNQEFMLEVQNTHTLQIVQNMTTNTPSFNIRGLEPATDFTLTVFAFNEKGKSEPLSLEAYTLKTEEITAGATTKLESKNPMRFVPILGMLVGIVLVLVLLAMAVVAVIKSKARQNHRLAKHEGSTSQSLDTESCSPDVIPHQKVVGLIYSSFEDLSLKHIEVTDKKEKDRCLPSQNTFSAASKDAVALQGIDCQYAELSFQVLPSDSDQLIPKKTQPTIYAQIDYAEMGSHVNHVNPASSPTGVPPRQFGRGATSPEAPTSMLAPYLPPAAPGSRLGTLKKVQFLDEAEGRKSDKYKTGSLPRNSSRRTSGGTGSAGHLCPLHAGTLPRNYSTQNTQGHHSTQNIQPSHGNHNIQPPDSHVEASIINCSGLAGQSLCSPVKDIESNL